MCEFPSWIKDEKGKAFWLVDKDIERAIEDGKLASWNDATGHSAIEKVLGVKGRHVEGREGLPEGFASDIRAGKCNRMAKVELTQTLEHVRDLVPHANDWAAEAWEKADGVHEMRKLLDAAGLLDKTDKRIWQDLALACAESVLPIFEKRRPGDDRPRKAIEAARGYLDGSLTKEQLLLVRRNAYAAAYAAAYADAAYDAAYAAAEAAADADAAADAAYAAAAYAAAYAAADDAARKQSRKASADFLRKRMGNPFKEKN